MKRLTVFIPEHHRLRHWSSSEWDLELCCTKCRQPCQPHEPWWWAAYSGEGKLRTLQVSRVFPQCSISQRMNISIWSLHSFWEKSLFLPTDVACSLMIFFGVFLWCLWQVEAVTTPTGLLTPTRLTGAASTVSRNAGFFHLAASLERLSSSRAHYWKLIL